MGRSILAITLLASLFISSCGNKESDKKKEDPDAKKEKTGYVHEKKQANMLADISISGMCKELNCIGAFKQLFSAMAGVVEIDFYFNEKTATNHAKVKFDNCKINDKDLVSAIEKLNDGAYKVNSVELKKLEKKNCPAKHKAENEDASTASFIKDSHSSSSPGFALPSILDVFDIL